MDIGAWLRGLGLEQYEPAFRANDIDGEVLPRLTAEDLACARCHVGRPPPQAARGLRCPAQRGASDSSPARAGR